MCGIVGYVRTGGMADPSVLSEMIGRVRHRGPDGDGEWVESRYGVALGHTRLKVQDLSEAAHQPMRTADGAFTLVFNGEIYNFRELREELRAAGAAFRSTGDTEVLLELCRRDPELGFLPRLNGMFAFAVWDAAKERLSLARDRTGVKPLLYSESSGGIAFASEMAAIRPAARALSIEPMAVYELLSLGFIAAPRTIFRQVRKLRPGHVLRFGHGRSEVRRWSPEIGIEGAFEEGAGAVGSPGRSIDGFEAACERIRGLMGEAVSQRLVADVPVGVFLSGGIDSAIVAATAGRVSRERVKTFSVGFPDDPFYDESRYAESVARMHGTEHTRLALRLSDVMGVIPIVQEHLGEPFADSSALPTYLLSRLTKEHVTVALSGDGADELFAGYNRYAAATLWRRYGWFARTPLYGALRSVVERMPAKRERRIGGWVSQMKRALRSMDRDSRRRQANWMRTSDDRTFARILHDPGEAGDVIGEIAGMLWGYRGEGGDEGDLNRHLRVEWQTSLPDDMLVKVDLMSMAHGLEVRSPFLDYRLAEAVFGMPWEWKLSGFRKKHILIEAFRNELPEILHDRPKKGFEVPVGPWLRGPLYGMARELIEADRCFFGTVLSREGARAILEEHRTGRADHNFCLWALVSLLAWQQEHAPEVCVDVQGGGRC